MEKETQLLFQITLPGYMDGCHVTISDQNNIILFQCYAQKKENGNTEISVPGIGTAPAAGCEQTKEDDEAGRRGENTFGKEV